MINFESPILRSIMFFSFIMLAAFLLSCGGMTFMTMGHGALCPANGHFLITLPNQDSLFLGLLIFIASILYLKISVPNKSDLQNPSSYKIPDITQVIFHPTSAFVLARTIQRKVFRKRNQSS